MKRKNNWNLLGIIVLIAMCAFMLISCQQGPTLNPYKTLTLDIEGQQQKLYYGDDAWYNALSDDGLLIDDNKVTGDDVKFTISETKKWTVTFKKNTPAGANADEITISHESVELTPELTLTPGDLIDNTGKVIVSSISEDVTVTGTYPPKAIGESVTASSANPNYEFAGWMVKGVTIDNIADYEISGDTEIVANWKNVSPFKVLIVKDGDEIVDTVYYNTKDRKWYAGSDTTSDEKTTVATPQDKTYTITLNYDNDTPNDSGTATSSFSGYEDGSEVKVQADGLLSGYTINSDTTLFAKWSKAKFEEPSQQPTNDGYTFNGWYNGEKPYDFNSVVTGDITITAHWTKKTFNTLTLDIAGQKQTLYYGSDNAWYKAVVGEEKLLIDDNRVTGDAKFNIPSDPTWTVTFNKNTPAGASDSEITISRESVVLTSELSLSPDNVIDKTSGKVHPGSISGNVNVIGTYPPKAIGDDVTALSDNENYEFAGWMVNGVTIGDIKTYEVSGDTEIVANWKNISDFKILTVKDGDEIVETVYYYTDGKWYKERSTTSEIKTSVKLPEVKEKEYTITFNTDGGSTVVPVKIPTSFLGYGLDDNTSPIIEPDGLLKDYRIENDTVFVSKWKEVKFTQPENPTRDGYVFNGWYNGDDEYSFDNVVKGDITLVAHWKEKPKKLTVKDGVNEQDTAWYSREDNKWYADENMTGEKTSVKLPEVKEKEYTITFNTDGGSTVVPIKAKSSFLGYGTNDNTNPVILSNGLLSGCTISDAIELVSLWSDATFNKPTDPTKGGYTFNGWYNGDVEYTFDRAVTEDITLVAVWTQKTYKTLTLNITNSDAQTLYYGSDDVWYKALGEGGLLIDDNKVTGDDVKFNIPEAPTWTVTFNKNTPADAIDSEILISCESVEVTSELRLSDDNVIDKTTGKVLKSSISENVTVTGTYPPKAIGQDKDIIASSTNVNYEFEKWTTEGGEEITDITSYPVSSNITIKATWKNVDFKVLTIKDGDVEKDTVYYNKQDGKWYKERSTKSEVKTSVALPVNTTKTYTLTLDYANGDSNGDGGTVTSSFLGYRTNDNTIAVIEPDGLLKDYRIENDTVLVSKWDEVKFTKPADPTRDGYVFDKWTLNDTEYNFESAVNEDITLVAVWTKKTFNTLTLDIAGQQQKLYYGSDNAWYEALGEGDLLLVDNKVTGENVKFNIPETPTWTVMFDKNVPNGASVDDFTITPASLPVKPELSLSPSDLIDNTGKVSVDSIDGDKVVTGTYPSTAIGKEVTASSTNKNYEFEKWTTEGGEDITDITSYPVSGNITIKATWKNVDFKVLTVKDGDVEKDTVYYNKKDGKWYKERSTKSEVITSVALPDSTTKTYTITLDYDNDGRNATRSEEVTSSFLGYGVDDNTSEVKVLSDGSFGIYTINSDTTLFAKWNKEKYSEPSDPTRDGYTFNGWYNGENPYNFDNVVTGNMTLTAHWTKKTFKTLTLNITNSDAQTLYYGSDNVWYKALGEGGLLIDDNKVTGDDVKFNIPELVWRVTFDKNAPKGASESDFTITPAYVDVTPVLTLTPGDLIDNAGKVITSSISENKTVTGTYPSKAIVQSVTASSDNPNYEFAGWTVNDVTIDNITTYAVSGNITIKANWKNTSSFKALTVKDGGVVKDTAYYNTKDGKWYAGSDITSGEKPSVLTLPNIEYTITFNTDGGSTVDPVKVIRPFSGYEDGSEVKVHADGLLSGYEIYKDTELVSLWSDATFNKPSEQPTKNGYVFNGWYNGDVEYNFNSVVTGDMTLVAHWKEKPKKLTVKDGVNEQDTAWYSREDKKWYANENMTDEKTSVDIPQDREYTITLDYDNNGRNETRSEKVPSSFRGYGVDENTIEVIGINGLLSNYTITQDTELVSLWSKEKFNEPSEQPTKDGYVFDKWYKDGQPYDFNSVVTGNMTLTANWTKKTFKTLTLNITDSDAQTLYYGSDNAWYNAVVGEEQLLLDRNKITGDVKFNIPSAPTWTVTLNKNRPQNAPFSDAAITLSQNQLTLYPKDGVFSSDEYISKDGIVKVTSITENVNVTLDTSRRYPSENVTATTPDSIRLLGWKIGDQTITDLTEYEVTADNINLNASWGYKVSIGELKVPAVGISDADRGFYTTTQDIDDSVADKSKQQREAYYAEGETVKLYYCNSSIRDIEITLKNEWSGETKLIKNVGDHDYRYSLLEIAPMVNQPLSISFKVTKSEQV